MRIYERTEFRIFITVFLILAFFISHYGGSYMADSMLATTQAMIDGGSIIIDEYVKPGCINTDSKSVYGCDHALYKGHWYSGFPPGPSFLALPSYLILKPFTYLLPDFVRAYPKTQIQTMLLNIFATLLMIISLSSFLSVLIYRVTGHFTQNNKFRILTSFLFSFGTLFFYYSTEFDARVLATFFSFLSFYILFKSKAKGISSSSLFWAGFAAATAVTMEYMQVIMLAIISIYALSLMKNKKIIYFAIGAAVPLLLMLTYHYTAFDSPFITGYDLRQGEDKLLGQKSIFSAFDLSNMWLYTFSPAYGIFFYMPLLLLCLYGLYAGFKEKKEFLKEWLVIGTVLIAYLVAISSFVSVSSCTFGPRYLIVIIPFMFLALPLAMEKIKMKWVLAVGAISVFINALPVLYMVENTGCVPGIAVIKNFVLQIPHKGLTNYTFNLINQEIFSLNYIWVTAANLAILSLLGLLLWKLWKSD